MWGKAADYGQSTPQANYDVWVASGQVGATERILYDDKKMYKNPKPPKDGFPDYRHGHAGW